MPGLRPFEIQSERILYWLGHAILPAVIFGAIAYISITLTRGDGRIAAVWLPNACAIAFLLRTQVPNRAMFFASMWAGNISANLLVGDTLLKAMGLSTANMVEIALTISLMQRFCGSRPDLHKLRPLMILCLTGGLLAPSISATLATLFLQPLGNDLISYWGKWMLTDGLGIVIFSPAIVIVVDAFLDRRMPTKGELLEWLALMALSTALVLYVFIQTIHPILFLIAPMMVLIAYRLGPLATAMAMVKMAAISVVCTYLKLGPVTVMEAGLGAQLVVLQLFLASSFLVSLPMATAWQDLRKMMHQSNKEREQFELLADNMADAVLRYSPDGTCLYASPSVQRVLGASSSELVGSNTLIRAHPEAAETLRNVTARLGSGQSETERFTYRRLLDDENGQPVYIEALCKSVRSRGSKPESVIISVRDVTDRINLERELDRARRHAESAASAKSEFLANMSHEIRTPMNGVLGFAELLQLGELSAEQRRQAKMITDSGRSMMALLNDILDISKIESGKINIAEEPVDLPHLIKQCLSIHTANAESKGLELKQQLSFDTPRAVLTDPQRLRQIILNLIGNAVKFTDMGSVTVRARIQRQMLKICVEDTGVGIPEDRLEAIFTPFVQVDGKTSRRFGGTGLGLTISRQLARLIGGDLTVESVEMRGSRFELSIPFKPAIAESVVSNDDQDTDETDLPPLCKTLLVEDVDINQVLATSMLQTLGQDPDIAEDGEVAVKKVIQARDEGHPYDLVFMDIQMPHCDGYEATRRIRAAGIGTEELPIVAITANAYADDIQMAYDVGMQGHITKPLRRRELADALRSWLNFQRVPERNSSASEAELSILESESHEALQAAQDGDLTALWNKRREDTLYCVYQLLETSDPEQETVRDVARAVHRLAGTAGMFGEDELGKHAAVLEQVLLGQNTKFSVKEAAKKLLRAA